MSQDVFQPKLYAQYQGIPIVTGISGDIVAGKTPEEHDTAMICLLDACRTNIIRLNSDKLQLKQHNVDFYVHTYHV